MASLISLNEGESGYIDYIIAPSELKTRLRSMGLIPGKLVTVMRKAPMNGPIQLRIGTTDILIRPQDAVSIFLESR